MLMQSGDGGLSIVPRIIKTHKKEQKINVGVMTYEEIEMNVTQ